MRTRIAIGDTSEIAAVLRQIAEEAATEPGESDRALAERAVRRLRQTDLRELAVREVASWIDHFRRGEAREVERQAQEAARKADEEARRVEMAQLYRAKERSRFHGLLPAIAADPSVLDPNRRGSRWLDLSEREELRDFLGDGYQDWYSRGCDLAKNYREERGQKGVATFESTYHPGGIDGYYAERTRRRMDAFVEEIAAEVRLEVTAELLATHFALGDGTRVTWGSATVEQHRQRIEMLAAMASGTVETAARHQSAIAMLEAAGAASLADLTGEDAIGVAA